jgi:oxygen-independent coproporphyrinogen-3 oxidase
MQVETAELAVGAGSALPRADLNQLHKLRLKYDRPVPRYTSYPTAPQFHDGVEGAVYGEWLGRLAPSTPLSLYLHIPFCDSLCWFCGCHTRVTRRYTPLAAYVVTLLREIELVAARLPGRSPVTHIHWGGGSPTMLAPADMRRIARALRAAFAVAPDAEFAVEIDPRGLADRVIDAMSEIGVNRVSLGVQDIHPEVQTAINRDQPFAVTQDCVRRLRAAGLAAFNCDLMYGLPHQDTARVLETVDAVASLVPDRIALFGYAHVPHMKPHQRLIPEDALPGGEARLEQSQAAAERLQTLGYRRIGLDHFARPSDPLARAAASGALHRNFQGYTTDPSDALLGFGASAIGKLPQGYVQNAVPIAGYRRRIDEGLLAAVRGVAFDGEDRLRAAIIERIMCDLEVDLERVSADLGTAFTPRARERATLAELADDGVIELAGPRLRVTGAGRPFVRQVAAAFDSYLHQGAARRSRAI